VPTLFSIIEAPSHPRLSDLYRRLGLAELRLPSQRKAIQALKREAPDFATRRADATRKRPGHGANPARDGLGRLIGRPVGRLTGPTHPLTQQATRDRRTMEEVKKTDTHRIYKKRSGRHAVQDMKTKQWVNGDDKAAILRAEGLIEPPKQKAPAPEGAEGSDEAAGDGAQ